MKTLVLTCFGYLFLGLGIIGIVLPVWPTTPFVLVSVACFSSSPNIKVKIMKIPFFREHLENYHQRKGLSKKTFITSMVWLWGMIFLSIGVIRSLNITLLLFFIASAVTWHLYAISKPRHKEKK